VFRPSVAGPGGVVAVVGTNLAWIDSGPTAGGAQRGWRKWPLAGGDSEVFTTSYGGSNLNVAVVGSNIFFASHQGVCRLTVP
jgi:hypothetical protein